MSRIRACGGARVPDGGIDGGGRGLPSASPLPAAFHTAPERVTIQPLDTACHFLIKGAKQRVAGDARLDG
jgi:hypothetical protein